MIIKIKQCSDSLMWYGKYVGSTFVVHRETPEYYWCREPDIYKLLNIVHKKDAIILQIEANEQIETNEKGNHD